MNLIATLLRRPPAAKRSPKWRALEHWYLWNNPACEACGGLLMRQVHHVIPFHVRPDLELDKGNLMVLCMRPFRSCHIKIGHLGNWQLSNPEARRDAALMLIARKGPTVDEA